MAYQYQAGDILSKPVVLEELLSHQATPGTGPLTEQQSLAVNNFLKRIKKERPTAQAVASETTVDMLDAEDPSAALKKKIESRVSVDADRLSESIKAIIRTAHSSARGLALPASSHSSGAAFDIGTTNLEDSGDSGSSSGALVLSMGTASNPRMLASPQAVSTASLAVDARADIEDGFKVLVAVLTGEAAGLSEAMMLAAAYEVKPAAAPGALTGQPKEGALAAPAPTPVAAERASAQCDWVLWLCAAGAIFYGINYALVSAYEAEEVFGSSSGVKVLAAVCASASFTANLAQIFVTLQTITGGDIRFKFNELNKKLNYCRRLERYLSAPENIISGVPLALLVSFVALSAAVPVGSSILNANRFFGMGEIAPIVMAVIMYAMRSMLIARSVLSLPKFIKDQRASISDSRRQSNYAMMTIAIASLAVGGLAGFIYSWGQIETTGKFLHKMDPEAFPRGSDQALLIQSAAFVGSGILNTFFVGLGTRDVALTCARVFSREGSTRAALVSVGVLALSVPTFFPGVAFVTGDALVKLVAAYSTLTSNDASLNALSPIAKTIILSEQICVAEKLVNLLTGLKVLLEGGKYGAEGKRDAQRFSAMAEILNASIRLMKQTKNEAWALPSLSCCRRSARAAVREVADIAAVEQRLPAEGSGRRVAAAVTFARVEGDTLTRSLLANDHLALSPTRQGL